MLSRSSLRPLLPRLWPVGRAVNRPRWALEPLKARPRCTSTNFPSQVRRKDVPTVDTIYALSTAAGQAAIAIIRISGPACLDIYCSLCPNKPFPSPRVATLRKLYSPISPDGNRPIVLDSGALVLYFPGPSTVTGEDILELHVHGGPAIVRSILSALPRSETRSRRRTAHYSAIRHAEPGEFTKRAFYNGRISLPEAESLGSLLAAETEQQRRLAVLGSESGLAERYETWRQMLLYARGELEALIDFSEDQYFDESPAQFMSSIASQVGALRQQLCLHIQNASRGELLRSGIRVALLGAPNAGKSSLLNRIVGREAAIVSAEEGTTRDIVDVSIDLDGWLVRLGDMAGLRGPSSPSTSAWSASTSDRLDAIGEVEKEGIRRARARALQSDVVVVLLSLESRPDGTVTLQMNDEVRAAALECQQANKHLIVAINKSDLIPGLSDSAATREAMQRYVYSALPGLSAKDIYFLSCKDAAETSSHDMRTIPNDAGHVQSFLLALTQTFKTLTSAAVSESDDSADVEMTPEEAQAYWAASLSVTHRQTNYLTQCLEHLEDFLAQSTSTVSGEVPSDINTQQDVDIVTAAEHLRYAANCLSKITGRGEDGDVEDVLGVVFEKFCVGK